MTTALPAHLLAKLGVKAPNTTTPAAVGGVTPPAPARPAVPAALAGVLTPAAAPRATPSLLPPESPMNPREAKVQAAAVVAAAPALDGAALLQSLGWANEEIDAMTDACFEQAVASKAQRALVDLDLGAPEADGFVPVEGFRAKVVEAAAPARRSRTSAPAPVVEIVAEPVVEVAAEVVEEVAAEVVEEVAAEAPKRRGRPPGSKNKATEERDAARAAAGGAPIQREPAPAVEEPAAVFAEEGGSEAAEEEIAQVVAGEQDAHLEAKLAAETATVLAQAERIAALEKLLAEKARVPAAAAAAFTLYIDCLPETPGTAFRTLDAVLAPFMEMVAKGYKNEKTGAPEPLSHYALVPFGKGPGAVAAHVLTNLASVTAPGILYVDTRSPCAAAVLEVLRPKADLIVSARGR